jgi:hypothetical protein
LEEKEFGWVRVLRKRMTTRYDDAVGSAEVRRQNEEEWGKQLRIRTINCFKMIRERVCELSSAVSRGVTPS